MVYQAKYSLIGFPPHPALENKQIELYSNVMCLTYLM